MMIGKMTKLIFCLILLSTLTSCEKISANQAVQTESAPIFLSMSPLHRKEIVKKGEVQRGQGLYQALNSIGIENDKALILINQLSDEVEFSTLKVGDQLEATYNEFNRLVKFSFAQNEYEKHVVTLNPGTQTWDYSFIELETYWRPRMVEGFLGAGSNLQSDLRSLGLNGAVVNEIVNILSCKVNFRMNARTGDRFQALLRERIFNDQVVQTKVLFASYDGPRAGRHEAFLYEDIDKSSTYTAHYTPQGQALINSGLRYPLARLHIRSGYGWRTHPVTGRRSMHRGVDLRGRVGERVHAVAAGRVIDSSFNEYAGNRIAIRHEDNSISYYYHLNRRDVKVGAWVRSHQVIGTVGATGRVTGPHLHFGFKDSRGRWMNPLDKRMIATPKLTGEKLAALQIQIAQARGVIADLKIKQETHYLLASLNDFQPRPSFVETLFKD
jgi:murein DD-endopeptidase MepM/ murein hydrolase activator NlpD